MLQQRADAVNGDCRRLRARRASDGLMWCALPGQHCLQVSAFGAHRDGSMSSRMRAARYRDEAGEAAARELRACRVRGHVLVHVLVHARASAGVLVRVSGLVVL